MKLNYNNQVNELIEQFAKNVDQMFGLCTTVQNQVSELANLVIDEGTDSSKKIAKEVIRSTNKIGEEAREVARSIIDESIEVAFPGEDNPAAKIVKGVESVVKKGSAAAKKLTKVAEKAQATVKTASA